MVYKWCKINHVSYYWYGFIVMYNIGYNIKIKQPNNTENVKCALAFVTTHNMNKEFHYLCIYLLFCK